MFRMRQDWSVGLWTFALITFCCGQLTLGQIELPQTNHIIGGRECTADGLSIRCLKTGYEADTLTLTNKLKCFDGARCVPYYYSISVFYSRCGYPRKNVKNYTNRFLRPWEAYSYHFAKADPNKCLEYVIHSCSRNTRNSRHVDCSNVFDITRY